MLRGVSVVAGAARSGKTQCLLDRYRSVMAQVPGTALWLAPTHRAAARVRERILGADLPGCLNPHCLTFGQFARRLLDASPLRVRPISRLVERQIFRTLIDEARRANKLVHFAPIADTPGFLDVLVGFVQELKRLEIWPHELQAAAGKRSQKDRELIHLYHEYQRVLTTHDLYDAQGRFWSARARLRDGQMRPFERVQHVFVDGFADFTRTEHEILDLLADRVQSLSISLPLDTARADLFSKAARTLAELRRRHAGLAVEELPTRTSLWPAMDHLERSLFAGAAQIAEPPEAAGIEIVTAASVTNEVELLARRIKTLLVQGDPPSPSPLMGESRGEGDGAPHSAPSPGLLRNPSSPGGRGNFVRPGDVLVVFRSLADVADLVREVFAEFGIPVAIGARPGADRAPVTAALSAWLRLDLDDWPFRQVLALLAHNYFRPTGPEWCEGKASLAAEHVVRRLQVPVGRAALESELERLSAGGQASRERSTEAALLTRHAQLAWPLVQRIGKLLDELPTIATPSVWARAITEFATQAGILRFPQPSEAADEVVQADHRAWQQLIDAVHASERLSTWLGQPPEELSRAEFTLRLQEILRVESLAASSNEAGRVRVLGAESARHLSAPYVFVAGLSERSFPPPDREDCLYSDAETGQLVAAGLPLVSQAERRGHEMLLFYEVVTRATRRLVLSYPALDEAAQPLSPSPYVSEIERAFAPRVVPRSTPADLSPVPPSDAVYCPRDFRVRAVAVALEGSGALLAGLATEPLTAATAENLRAGLQASMLRQRGESFGPFEGMLTSQAALAALGKRFGPEHCWSASQLEQYAHCPYQFFIERVLGIEAIEDPVLTVDYLRRGSMLHWLLAELHRRLNEQAGEHASPADMTDGEFAALVSELLAQLTARQTSDRPLDNGLLEVDVRRLTAWLADYRRQHAEYDKAFADWDKPLRPAHFEFPFGVRRGRAGEEDDEPDALMASGPLELLCGGEMIRFGGRIDRVDLGQVSGQAVLGIIDYKSGRSESAKVKAITEGLALQLPLYALAAQQMLAEGQPAALRVAYWHVAGKGCKEVLDLYDVSDGKLSGNRHAAWLADELPARVYSLVSGIRQGQFPMHSADDKCTSQCPYSTVCRVNQVRALGKQWVPPGEAAP